MKEVQQKHLMSFTMSLLVLIYLISILYYQFANLPLELCVSDCHYYLFKFHLLLIIDSSTKLGLLTLEWLQEKDSKIQY